LVHKAVDRAEGDEEMRQPHVELAAEHLHSCTWASGPGTDGFAEGRPSVE
jgi:hypothetical protein